MMSRILLFVVGLLAAAGFACTPAGGPPPPGGTGVRAACAVDNIGLLSEDYVNPLDPHFTPVASGSPPDTMVNDIKAAYDIAPQFFKDLLCGLTGIFVVPEGASWGMRNPDTGRRYIALSADLWTPGGPPKPLTAYENDILRQLLPHWHGAPPGFAPGLTKPLTDPAFTLLAAMAHEFGHVLFYDTLVPQPGSAPAFDSTAFCDGNFFAQSWDVNSLPRTPIYWRRYDDIAGLHLSDDVQIRQILKAIAVGGNAAGLLDRFYSRSGTGMPNGRWASLWAGFAPDQDFVETFTLFVLLNNIQTPFTSLKVDIPGHRPHDIVATCSTRPALMNKLSCFQRTYCPTATDNVCGRVCP